MVCRSVQLWFPSTEMSGGQSAGGAEGLEAAAAERAEDDEVAVEGGLDGFRDLVMAAHSANGVQVRHLFSTRIISEKWFERTKMCLRQVKRTVFHPSPGPRLLGSLCAAQGHLLRRVLLRNCSEGTRMVAIVWLVR